VNKKGCYGFFLINTPKETVDSFIIVEGTLVDLEPA